MSTNHVALALALAAVKKRAQTSLRQSISAAETARADAGIIPSSDRDSLLLSRAMLAQDLDPLMPALRVVHDGRFTDASRAVEAALAHR
eukprot:6184942-Pleurochrysis_carterae.AAC.4